MRRAYAAILFVPLFALIAGAIRLPEICPKAKEAQCSMPAKMHGGCMMLMAMQKCSRNAQKAKDAAQKAKDAAQKAKDAAQKSKDGENGKTGCACCLDCPLCSLVTFKPVFRLEITRQFTTIDYTVMSDNHLSDYAQQHWKPPNPSFVSWI